MKYLNKIIRLTKHNIIQTEYSHLNNIYKSNNKFIFEVDCSGLLEFWLSKRYPLALKDLKDFIKTEKSWVLNPSRIYSMDFYDLFQAISNGYKTKHWTAKSITQKLEPGDILAFINPQKKGRFGHVAIIDKVISHTSDFIKVRVIDSSNIKHDNQWRQSDKMGLGYGNINIYLKSPTDIMISYQENVLLKRELEVGRLVDLAI